MLEIKNLSAGYTNYPVISDVSIKVEEHSVVSVIGPNGAGKTSLMRAIMGQLKVFSGSVMLKGEDITKLRTDQRVKNGITLVPERRRIFPYMTVMENLEIGGYLVRDKELFEKQLDNVFELFPRLRERANQLGGTMSGGEQQMLSIGRAMMLRPQMMLLDEPSVGLAPKTVDQVYEAILNLNKQGITLLVIEQNISKALTVASSAFVIQRGRIVMHASPKELSENPKLVSTYLTSY